MRGADRVTWGTTPRVMDSSTKPIDDASALVQRIYALLLEAHRTRQRLTAMHTDDRDVGGGRVVYLGMVSAFEDGLRRTLEEAIATLKTIKGDEAEAWLRRRLEGLERA
jgi:hypothetical protein